MNSVETITLSPATIAFLRDHERHQREASAAEQRARIAVMHRYGLELDGPSHDHDMPKWRAIRYLADREALAAKGAFLSANPEPRVCGVRLPA